MQISPTVIAVIAVAALIVIAVVVLLWERKRKTDLKRRFGTEYERAVRERGSEREAQAALEAREKGLRSSTFASLVALNEIDMVSNGELCSHASSMIPRGPSLRPTRLSLP